MFATSAHAAATFRLLNYQQVVNLSTDVRAAYLGAIRSALIEIEMQQRKSNSASLGKLQRTFAMLSRSEQAFADDSDQCLFAGWIGKFGPAVDGHRFCTAPAEALVGCAQGEIKCSPALFGDHCVKRDTFATSTCDTQGTAVADVAKQYLSDPKLKASWAKLTADVDAICKTTTQQQNPCKKIEDRIAVIQKSASLPTLTTAITAAPSSTPAQPSTTHTTIDAVKNEKTGQVTEHTPCKTDRDQGTVGPCHAFCILCTLDRMAASQGFRTSANWVMMLSAIDRVCDSNQQFKSSQDLLNQTFNNGYDPEYDYKLAMKYGYCSEQFYLPYSATEPVQMASAAAKTTSTATDPFAKQFGITPDELKSLYCPPNHTFDPNRLDPDYPRRLEQFNHSTSAGAQAFYQCAKQSLKTAAYVRSTNGSCTTVNPDLTGLSPAQVATKVKEAIAMGYPVSVKIAETKTAAIPHCVNVTGFDPQGQQFDIINSHGIPAAGAPKVYSTDPIKIDNDPLNRKILGLWYMSCSAKSGSAENRSAPAQSGSRR